ncbi:MAG TPA: ComEC/Rec2 family competence protein [Phycisphaerales bacterium]|nr:ComEC/Rec2 family competence protein [Phycisphaerales bacterium]
MGNSRDIPGSEEGAAQRVEIGAKREGLVRRTLGFEWKDALGNGWRVTVIAWAFAAGIALGWDVGKGFEQRMIVGAGMCVLGAGVCGWIRRESTAIGMLVLASGLMGAAWMNVHYRWARTDDVLGMVNEEGAIARVRGVVMERPELRAPVTGLLGRFGYRKPATYFHLSVRGLVDERGKEVEARGVVSVKVDETIEPMRAGDEVEVTGFLRGAGSPKNPGEFDYRISSRGSGEAGLLSVEDRGQIKMLRKGPVGVRGWWWKMRAEMQSRACDWLLKDLPATKDTERDALLAALLLGARTGDLDGLDTAFARVGLAHILAISGMNLALLAAFVLWVARLGGRRRAWHAWLMVGVVLAYLMMIDVRAPILRSAVMVVAASLGLAARRRVHVTGLVSMSLIALLAWKPEQIFEAGFQLSFGVVYALVIVSGSVRARWFGEHDPDAVNGWRMCGEWLKTGLAVNVTAWMSAWPITVCQFGVVTPMGALATFVGAPVASVVMVLGYVRMLLAVVLPSGAVLVGWALVGAERVLIGLVRWLDGLPGTQVHVPMAGAWWAVCAGAWCLWWGLRRRGEGNVKLMWCACGALVVWLRWPVWARPMYADSPALRVDMMSIGDGSSYVIRSAGTAVMFDSGSSSVLNSAHRIVIPAMRTMNVRTIDAMVITHTDLDHFSDALDLADEFGIGELMVNEAFAARAGGQTWSAAEYMLNEMRERGVKVSVMHCGDQRTFGDATWTWIHPGKDEVYEKENDESAVVRIEAAGRVVMMCGDLGPEGADNLMKRGLELKADVMELPHHGSFNKQSVALLKGVRPSVVLQSTGYRRWRSDKWKGILPAEMKRYVTVRDGESWVEIEQDGKIQMGCFVGNE